MRVWTHKIPLTLHNNAKKVDKISEIVFDFCAICIKFDHLKSRNINLWTITLSLRAFLYSIAFHPLAGSKSNFVVFSFSQTTCLRCERCVIFYRHYSWNQIGVVARSSSYCFIAKYDPIAFACG